MLCREAKIPLPSKSNKHLVLDLDETLVHTFGKISPPLFSKWMDDYDFLDVKKKLYSISLPEGHLWGLERNYLHDFLNFTDTYCDSIDLWSAGEYQYVHEIVDRIFSGHRRPERIFTRGDCVMWKGEYMKPLAKIWTPTTVRPENTFFIDDNPAYMRTNEGNAIIIPAYDPIASGYCDDNLPRLMNWLSLPRVMGATDVRTLDKKRIFN